MRGGRNEVVVVNVFLDSPYSTDLEWTEVEWANRELTSHRMKTEIMLDIAIGIAALIAGVLALTMFFRGGGS